LVTASGAQAASDAMAPVRPARGASVSAVFHRGTGNFSRADFPQTSALDQLHDAGLRLLNLRMRPAPRVSFPQPSPHGFHRVVYDEWAIGQHARRRLRPDRNARLHDPQPALSTAPRASVDMPRRGRVKLADPSDYALTYLTVLTLLARSGAGGGLGWNVDGRASGHHRRSATGRRSRGSSSTTWDPDRARAESASGVFHGIRHSRRTAKSRSTSALLRTLRSAQRSVGAPHCLHVRQRADGLWALASSRHRSALLGRPTAEFVALWMRSIARRLSCTATIHTCFCPRQRRDGVPGPKPTVLISPASAMPDAAVAGSDRPRGEIFRVLAVCSRNKHLLAGQKRA
jgi:hypothetical protein